MLPGARTAVPEDAFGGANSLLWDGKSNGVVVPGGVYIYQISAEGKTFNGTIVVVK